MSSEFVFGPKCNLPISAFCATILLSKTKEINFIFKKDDKLKGVENKSLQINNNTQAALYIAKHFNLTKVLPTEGSSRYDEVMLWINFALNDLKNPNTQDEKSSFECALKKLNLELILKTYICGYYITLADFIIFEHLHFVKEFQRYLKVGGHQIPHLKRFYEHMLTLFPIQLSFKIFQECSKKGTSSIEIINQQENIKKQHKTTDVSGMDIDLPDAKIGKVVTRFPPEASGYLHIGHAKAALLNDFVAKKYKGKLIIRFDDTNPVKEKQEYQESIKHDLSDLLHVKPTDGKITYSSDYFDFYIEKAEELIKIGKAFVDDTDRETLKKEKKELIESKNRNNSIEKNLKMWEEMKKGSDEGKKYFLRAKIDMKSLNGSLRDPVLFRGKSLPHLRTGSKYKIYPTYDFCCPLVDSLEGVTHSMRTSEYNDRNAQYIWILDSLNMRKPFIYDFSKFNLTYCLMSKRKLTLLVEQKVVDGWDDPRFPTLKGLFRRGLTYEGLKEFIYSQGGSRNIATLDYESLWGANKKYVDTISPRFSAIHNDDPNQINKNFKFQRIPTILNIKNYQNEAKEVPNEMELRENPLGIKDSNGKYKKWYFNKIFIEQEQNCLY
jgi:glutamyl-tRNA synthetase